jgi:hypothetical protein
VVATVVGMHRDRAVTARPMTGPVPRPRGRTPGFVFLVGGLALLLAACGTPSQRQDGPAPSGGTPTASATAFTTATPVADATTEPAGGESSPDSTSEPSSTPRPLRTCAPEVLDVVLGSTDSGAGSIDQTVVVTNRGPRTCTISGAPTARLISAAEDQLGAAATGSGASGPVVRLAPGGAATTVVRIVHVGEDGGPLGTRCTPQPAVALAIDSDVYARYDRLDGDFRGCAEPDVPYMAVSPFRAA